MTMNSHGSGRLAHDAAGFLVGELVDLSRETRDLQERSLTVAEAMRRDVGRILKLLRSDKPPQEPARRLSHVAREAAALRQRDDKGKFVAQPAAAGAQAAGAAFKQPAELPPAQGVPSLGTPPAQPAPTVVVNVAVPGEPQRRQGPIPQRDASGRVVASPQLAGHAAAGAGERARAAPQTPVTVVVPAQAGGTGAPGAAGKRGQRGPLPVRDTRREPATATPQRRQPAQDITGTTQPARAAGASRSVAEPQRRPNPMPERGVSGRFVAGQQRPGAPRTPGERDHEGGGSDRGLSDKLGKLGDAFKGMGSGADQIDPAIAAAGEVKQVLEPLRRGAAAIFGRSPERQKERKRDRWYTRILKAITGKKDQPAAMGGAGGSDVQSGSFFGTLFGGLLGKVMGGLGAVFAGILPMLGGLLMRVFAPIAAAWAAWELGQWLGGKIYEWLDKSGIAGKVFEAFDAIGTWWKDRIKDPVTNAAKKMTDDYQRGREQAEHPPTVAP
ncbi:MAG TPA: hypothetical protein VLJ86_05490, partial [Ramlibacter sp.]|nr:hypothetical protein [Ramlibacter sp.]